MNAFAEVIELKKEVPALGEEPVHVLVVDDQEVIR